MERFVDRSRRLTLFGVLSLLLGSLGILLALLHLALPLLTGLLPSPDTVPTDPATILAGAMVYGLLGGAMAWLGFGSLKRRRWTRPLMLILAWTWWISGAFGLWMIVAMAPDLVLLATVDLHPLPEGLTEALEWGLIAATVVVGLLLPVLWIWAYTDRDVGRTCEQAHPEPAWTDRCPLAVLGLSVGMGFVAALTPAMALRPAVPWFGHVATGWTGAAIYLAGGLLCAILAVSTYRLEPRGWWVTSALLLLIGVSATMTFLTVDMVEFYRAMGYPERFLAALEDSSGGDLTLALATVVVTLLSLAYMAAIHRHYRGN